MLGSVAVNAGTGNLPAAADGILRELVSRGLNDLINLPRRRRLAFIVGLARAARKNDHLNELLRHVFGRGLSEDELEKFTELRSRKNSHVDRILKSS